MAPVGRSPDAAHDLLQRFHDLSVVNPEQFQQAYASTVRGIAAAIEGACFDDYALVQGGEPTALHFAAGCGCLELCACLLQRCGRLNFATDRSGRTPLCWAAERGLCGTLHLLMQKGADVLHTDSRGRQPLHLAAAGGFAKCCKLLLERPCTLQQCLVADCDGFTPLHLAAKNGSGDICRMLCHVSRTLAAEKTAQRQTALHLAAIEGHDGAVESLLASAPEILGVTDSRSMTALHHAKEKGWRSMAQQLDRQGDRRDVHYERWMNAFQPSCRALLVVEAVQAAKHRTVHIR
eukprot:TRINITY_DN18460_c0_g1_i2.p1 TRINITY_DN18460_c0_g1~~TRINITY_DN18460_c0_g1_i2.p1  ORF type:complete len:292 (-),score=41.66 TRINITY_DN18460_c0_g1_i2:910-1785(-)